MLQVICFADFIRILLTNKQKQQMKKTIQIMIAAAMLGVLFTSCKKETGPTGPQGATGPQGPAGNANVMTFTVNTSTSSFVLGCSNTCWYSSFTNTSLTSNNVDKAAVLCFMDGGNGTWVSLPLTVNDMEIYYTYSLLEFDVRTRSASGSTSVSNPGNGTFKVVIIPPSGRIANVNHSSYESVKQAYNLKD